MTRVRRVVLLTLVACAVLASGCDGRASTGTLDSGVEGSMVLAPTCPVEQLGASCPERPAQALITVTGAGSGQILKKARSAADGAFRISLRPGRYLVSAQPIGGEAGVGGSLPTAVSVVAHQYAPVTMRIDSGIR